jgi:hypothetical protein
MYVGFIPSLLVTNLAKDVCGLPSLLVSEDIMQACAPHTRSVVERKSSKLHPPNIPHFVLVGEQQYAR